MSRAVAVAARIVLIVGLVGAALAACGGSSSKSAGNTTTSSAGRGAPTTTTAPGTTTAGATEPANDPTAAKAVLRLADVGAGFANYKRAGGVNALDPKSCEVTAPGAVLATTDHRVAGPMFKAKDKTYFAYSFAYTFRTEALAKKFAAFRATPAFKQCQSKQDNEVTRKASPGVYVKLTPVTYPDPGHIPTMYREYTGNTSSGKPVDNGFYDRYTMRRGRTVVVVAVDSSFAANPAGSQVLAHQTGDILRKLDTALTARLG